MRPGTRWLQTCTHLILEAIKRPRNTNHKPKSIQFQRTELKRRVLTWEQRFYNTHHSQAYDSAPPSSDLPQQASKTWAKYTNTTFLATCKPPFSDTMGHAFACACGAVPEDTEYILLQCPRTHHHRQRLLFSLGPIDLLRKVLDHPMRCLGLLRFLETTRICIKPWITWEP